MAAYNLTLDSDGAVDLIIPDSLTDDLLLSDEQVMDWLLQMDAEDDDAPVANERISGADSRTRACH